MWSVVEYGVNMHTRSHSAGPTFVRSFGSVPCLCQWQTPFGAQRGAVGLVAVCSLIFSAMEAS